MAATTTYLDLVHLTVDRFTDYYHHVSNQSVHQLVAQFGPSLRTLLHHNDSIGADLVVVLCGAVMFHLVRRACLRNPLITELCNSRMLKWSDTERFGESLYGLSFYAFSFLFAATIEYRYKFLSSPECIWNGFNLANPVPTSIWALYQFEMAHYLHGIYFVTMLKPMDQYSAVLLAHHVVAFALLGLSYLSRTHRIGVAVLYLHDLCDIFMQATKCINRMRMIHPVAASMVRILRIVCFSLFVGVWFIFRLYNFPLIVIYSCARYLTDTPLEAWFPGAFLLFAMLFLILAMNVYWAWLITLIVYNAIRGGPEAIEDIREQDYEQAADREAEGIDDDANKLKQD